MFTHRVMLYVYQAKHAKDIGADAVACVGPTFYKPQTLGNVDF